MNPHIARRFFVGRGLAAFSLVELLVGAALAAALAVLLIPAIQAARESARLTVCRHHVAQLAKAMLHHEAVWQQFPSGGWGPNWLPADGRSSDSAQPGGWTYGVLAYLEAAAVRESLVGLDESTATAAYQAFAATPLAAFACPSRRPARAVELQATVNYKTPFSQRQAIPAAALTDYAANGGSTATCPPIAVLKRALTLVDTSAKITFCHVPSGSGNEQSQSLSIAATEQGHADHVTDHLGPCAACDDDMATVARDPTSLAQGDAWRAIVPLARITLPDGGIPDLQDGIVHRMSHVSPRSVKDGLSQTYLVGEKHVAADRSRTGNDAGDDRAMYAGYSSGNVRWALDAPRPDAGGGSWPNAFGGPHRAGWTAACGDGSVRTVSFDIDLEVHRGLAARADGRGAVPD